MPTIMANGNETLQTITILQGKFFPPMAYARRADMIGFENRSSQVNQASDINGAWTTGDIAPGETVYMPYREMLVRALLANPLACIGQSFDCLRRVEYTTLTDPTETSEIVRVFPDGEIANHDRWNAFWVVVRGR